jgi:hypothetical protein
MDFCEYQSEALKTKYLSLAQINGNLLCSEQFIKGRSQQPS